MILLQLFLYTYFCFSYTIPTMTFKLTSVRDVLEDCLVRYNNLRRHGTSVAASFISPDEVRGKN